jgi:hypothetical protein
MHRYLKMDTDKARHFFQTAVRLDSTFSRAYAGLSFTHFQDAFQSWEKREPAVERACEAAAQGLLADERDLGGALGHGPGALAAWSRRLHLSHQPEARHVSLGRGCERSA